nr:hypothetical protein [Tanacetum cinerariifolium]
MINQHTPSPSVERGIYTPKSSKAGWAFCLGPACLQQTHVSQASGSGADEGTGIIPGVPDVPTDEPEEEISWNSTDEEGDDDEGKDGDGDDEGNDGDDDEEEFIHPSLSTHAEEETRDEESFDPIPKTLMMKAMQSSSVSLQFMTSMLNPTPDAGMESIFETTSQMDVQTPTSVAPLPMSAPTVTPSTIATITSTQQAPTPPITSLSTLIQNLPDFSSLFGFDNRLKTLEANFSEFMQTNQFAGASDRLRDEAQAENDEFLKTIDENMQKFIKEHVKEQAKVQVSKILPKIEQTVNEQLEAEVLTRSSNSSKTSYIVAVDLSEMEFKKILIEKIEGNKSIHRSNEQRNLYKALFEAYESDKIILDTYRDTVTLKRRRDDDADKDEEPSVGSDRGSKRRREGKEPESASAPQEKATRSAGKSTQGSKSRQTSTSESATAEEPMQTTFEMEEPSHPEFDTSADDQPIVEPSQHPEWFSQQKKPPTPDQLLAGPTYELMKESCKSLVELEFFLEEVHKATTDQLDWVNTEGQQYPHNLLKPLPLIPNNRGRRVIPFDHFINNDLEYLCGGASSRKYTTSVTKTKFYGFAVNRESARDVYSKRRIITVTELKIVEWHNYKHLDWIMVRRDDDKLYKFKEGDFKRLRIQDIEDMLLLLVQGNLKNLTVEERFAFNISLRMFTRSIVIQRRMKDLQLGVVSYQKKLNITKPDTYRSDLKRKEAYIAYSNPRGFIYQNKDKQNRLMRIDELHKSSDGKLTDVRTALDDRLKGIRMKYLSQSIWRKSDKDRAAAMIQAINNRLKTMRIMMSLERFVGGRLYEGDFWMLQRTI